MNYGGGPYVLMMLSRTKEAMGDRGTATRATTTTPTREEAISPDITNTAIRVKVTAITSRTQEVPAEIAAPAWEQCAVSAVSPIVASSDQPSDLGVMLRAFQAQWF